ncbi:juvenile hormone acid O-methyltransferase-like [Phlebotomus papatasi]|uniref:juvenile hormone acid O-methyltransferase-like n=1 Tax=Phlebotomus papatasi TaxID=29031 RepID=UPI002483FD7B|nr:juvenile hormone acid O-methyltransferase-like [Phlebotomus papatasi]
MNNNAVEMEDHRKINRHQREDAERFLEDFSYLFKWNSGESFIDLGCGPGDVTLDIIWPLLPRESHRLVCLDICPDQLDRCREEMAGKEVSFAQVDLGKRQDLSELGKFDHAISLMCLHWIRDQRIALENIHDLLRSQGDFFFSFVADCPNRKIDAVLVESEKWKGLFNGIPCFCDMYWRSEDPGELFKDLLSEIGFGEIVVETRKVVYQWKTSEEFISYYRTFSRLLKFVPSHLIPEFLSDQVDLATKYNLLASQRNPEDPVDPYVIVVGFARKI